LDVFIIISFKNIISDENMGINKIFGMIFAIWGLWFLLFIIVTIINIINVVKIFIQKDLLSLKQYTKKIKIGLIPFWILNFIGLTTLTIMINMPSHGFGIFIVPIPIMASYFVLMITSVFSILFLLILYKNNKINNKQFLIYILTQLLFVFDIIAIIYLFNKSKKENMFETPNGT
jgi:hypothetical protein